MGHMRHHAIVVTSYDSKLLSKAQDEALRLGMSVTPTITSSVNGYDSFMIGPDGSKEGWESSFIGDKQRYKFIGWLVAQDLSDGSSCLAWCVMQYGDENNVNMMVIASGGSTRRGSG